MKTPPDASVASGPFAVPRAVPESLTTGLPSSAACPTESVPRCRVHARPDPVPGAGPKRLSRRHLFDVAARARARPQHRPAPCVEDEGKAGVLTEPRDDSLASEVGPRGPDGRHDGHRAGLRPGGIDPRAGAEVRFLRLRWPASLELRRDRYFLDSGPVRVRIAADHAHEARFERALGSAAHLELDGLARCGGETIGVADERNRVWSHRGGAPSGSAWRPRILPAHRAQRRRDPSVSPGCGKRWCKGGIAVESM